MLDFTLLQKQLNEMVFEQKSARRKYDEKVAIARDTLSVWSVRSQELLEKLDSCRTSWLLADDIREPINTRHAAPPPPKAHTVIATDGSQIFPDRHELSACHLINIGMIVLHYGSGERPTLTNHPLLFYRDQDTYRQWNGNRIPVNADVISALRGAFEVQELTQCVEEAVQQRRTVAGLIDGTLILWTLEGKPKEFQREILNFYLTSFEQFRQYNAPIMSYISQPTSADVIHTLRVALCPEEVTNCDQCPYKDSGSELPCEPIAGVNDAILFATILRNGERSTTFKSRSEILSEYKQHTVYFFYLNVGAEIVRVEIPKWVAYAPELLHLAHAIAYDQAVKGQGYPVSLAEAHEQAVIRGNEREHFYRLIENLYVREGLEVAISRKSFKKRNVGI